MKPILPVALFSLASVALAQNGVGDWIGVAGGPDNARRALGTGLEAGLTEAWSVPAFSSPVIKNGVVVCRDGAGNTFSGYDLATGQALWQVATPPSAGYRGLAIAGNRVFIPCSRNGGGFTSEVTQVACYDLSTGVHQWTWSAGSSGSGSSLVALPAVLTGLPQDRVAFTAADVASNFVWSNNRMIVLDATAPDAASALLAAQAPAGNNLLSYDPPVFHRQQIGGASVANLFFYQHVIAGSPANWRSHRLRVLDAASLSEPGIPFGASPSLSGTTTSTAVVTIHFDNLSLDRTRAEILCVDSESSLRCWDLITGNEKFRTPIPGPTHSQSHNLGARLVGDVAIVSDSTNGQYVAFDRGTGAVAWTRSVSGGHLADAPGSPNGCVLDGDVMLISLANGDVVTLDDQGNVGAPVLQLGAPSTLCAAEGMYLAVAGGVLRAYRPATLTPRGPVTVGGTQTIDLRAAADAGRFYLCPFALGTTGFTLPGGRRVPLDRDFLFDYSISPSPAFLPGNAGFLSGSGTASMQVIVPNLAAIRGWAIHTSLITFDGLDVRTISDPLPLVLN